MTLREDHSLLRVFLPESDTSDGQAAWRAVVDHLRLAGLAGATAYRGRAGFTADGVSTDAIEVLACDLPVVVEAVDRPDRIEGVLDTVIASVGEKGLVTVERVEVFPRGTAGRVSISSAPALT